MESRYQIISRLGAGGMGVVFLAFDHKEQKYVAIKMLSIQQDARPALRHRLKREGEILKGLQHPNIVRVLESEHEGESAYLVSEYLPGADLHEILNATGVLSQEEAEWVALHLAIAMTTTHALGILHRDLKPANVRVLADGTIKLIDFGAARYYGDQADERTRITATGMIVGTPAYMSPEAILGRELEPTSDIFSLAALVLELLTGTPIFDGTPNEIQNRVMQGQLHLPAKLTALPAEFRGLLEQCLQIDAARRPSSMQQVLSALHTLSSEDRLEKGKHYLADRVRRISDKAPRTMAVAPRNEVTEALSASHRTFWAARLPVSPAALPIQTEAPLSGVLSEMASGSTRRAAARSGGGWVRLVLIASGAGSLGLVGGWYLKGRTAVSVHGAIPAVQLAHPISEPSIAVEESEPGSGVPSLLIEDPAPERTILPARTPVAVERRSKPPKVETVGSPAGDLLQPAVIPDPSGASPAPATTREPGSQGRDLQERMERLKARIVNSGDKP